MGSGIPRVVCSMLQEDFHSSTAGTTIPARKKLCSPTSPCITITVFMSFSDTKPFILKCFGGPGPSTRNGAPGGKLF